MRRVLLIGAMMAMAEREMLEGSPGTVELRGLMSDTDAPPSARPPYIRQQCGRTGKGERKRNRKHRWH